MPRRLRHPSPRDVTVDDVLYALADPVRRNIVAKLIDTDGMSCNEACAGLPPSTISFHHGVLRDAGLIRSEKVGVQVRNTVRRAEIDKRFPGLLDAILKNHRPR